MAVLDQLWQARERCRGIHVDENWYEYGDLPFDLSIDTALSHRLVEETRALGIAAKEVDYDGFPIDAGTIAAHCVPGPGQALPDGHRREQPLPRLRNDTAGSGPWPRERRSAWAGGSRSSASATSPARRSPGRSTVADDHVANPADDEWNRRVLELMTAGEPRAVQELVTGAGAAVRIDMGFKHFAWLAGAMGERWSGGATVHAYGPVYGGGAAVVEFHLGAVDLDPARSARAMQVRS